MDKKKLILLGGYDLEMLTIKRMLEGRSDCRVIDKHLGWETARLSAYQDSLSLYHDKDIYGVELREDIPVPTNYHRIDHHNEWSELPSALEQIATVMNMPLDREMQLIAANDKGYIPAMIALGATEAEIAAIRQRDRAAQGVKAEDERLAEESIARHRRRYGNLMVVRSMTSRFSPICDRLFPYDRLLIYTDIEWMFYGEGKEELVTRYSMEIQAGKMFHGGGANGYVGNVKNIYNKNQIEQFVNQIIEQYEYV